MKKSVIIVAAAIFFVIITGIYFNFRSQNSGISETQNQNLEPADYTIEIKNFAFSPAELKINIGETVQWTNQDSATHTVTSDDGLFNSGNLPNGASYTYTFDTKGNYEYHCSIHPSMAGKIIVE
jgi:plastocyanin